MTKYLTVFVKPNSRENKVISSYKEVYTIAIKAPAEDNKANRELIKFLKKNFGETVTIVKGLKSRQKTIALG